MLYTAKISSGKNFAVGMQMIIHGKTLQLPNTKSLHLV